MVFNNFSGGILIVVICVPVAFPGTGELILAKAFEFFLRFLGTPVFGTCCHLTRMYTAIIHPPIPHLTERGYQRVQSAFLFMLPSVHLRKEHFLTVTGGAHQVQIQPAHSVQEITQVFQSLKSV